MNDPSIAIAVMTMGAGRVATRLDSDRTRLAVIR